MALHPRGRPAEVARIATALQPLVEGSLVAHRRLAGLSGANDMITDAGWLKVYTSQAEFAATAPDRLLMDRCTSAIGCLTGTR